MNLLGAQDSGKLRFSVLGSSSSGNCTLVTDGETTILIDAGLPVNYTIEHLERMTGRSFADAIFVSHEHSDHVRNLFPLSERLSCPVYLSQAVSWMLPDGAGRAVRLIRDRDPVEVGSLKVTPFIVSHDAVDPFGFVVEGREGSVGIVTDCGIMEETALSLLRDLDGLVIESNYDDDMLDRGTYPAYLKMRIKDGKGHLSNRQCRDTLREIVGPRTRQIVLAHLSEENNDPLLALETAMEAFPSEGARPEVHVSYPRHPTPFLRL